MRKRNSKVFNNLLIVLGTILICLALVALFYKYYDLQGENDKRVTSTHSSIKNGELTKSKVNKKIDSLTTLKYTFEKITVGEEDSGSGGSKKNEVKNLLGKPDSKIEDYNAGEKATSYSWNYFPWDDPIVSVMITFRNGKVVAKSLDIAKKHEESIPGFLNEFNQMMNGQTYSKEEIIKKLGYPTSEMVLRHSKHQYEYFVWSDSNKIFSIELKDGELKERKQNEY